MCFNPVSVAKPSASLLFLKLVLQIGFLKILLDGLEGADWGSLSLVAGGLLLPALGNIPVAQVQDRFQTCVFPPEIAESWNSLCSWELIQARLSILKCLLQSHYAGWSVWASPVLGSALS